MPDGSEYARGSDPNTSKVAGAFDFTSKRDAALFVFGFYDRPTGLTASEVEDLLQTDAMISTLGEDPLGTNPWRRVSECKARGWIVALMDGDYPVVRLGHAGRYQGVYVLTPKGRLKAWQLMNRQ